MKTRVFLRFPTGIRKIILISLLSIGLNSFGQIPTYSCEIRNDKFVTSSIYEFDIYLRQTGTTAFELSNFQTGLKLNPEFASSGSITVSIIPGSSELNSTQAPISCAFDAVTNCIKIAPRTPPRNYSTGVTSGTLINSVNGQRVCTIRLTNTLAFGNIPVNYSWNFTVLPYNTIVAAFLPGTPKVNTNIINSAQHSKSENLTAFLEGLFNGAGNRKVQDAAGDHFAGPVADQITVKLAQAAAPYLVEYTASNVNLYTNGKGSFSIPGSLSGSHYLIVKHRNSIETWSALPVDFSGGALTYNFTDSYSRAYGSNLKQMGSIYAIFAGDVDQDGGIGTLDMGLVDNASAVFATGYLPEDIDGDGGVGTLDMGILDNNSSNFVTVLKP